MSTKNIGQVAGVHISNTPPENITLIWYDNTPSQMVHKVFDINLNQWVVLDKNTISNITYSELVNLATTVGLSVGAWFKISDRSNALALSVTSTKVQYSDSLGNILIDDLGTNIQYHVTSSNLSIDDVVGVFDNVNKKLVFQFNEQVPDYTADDFLLGKVKRNNVWSLAKYKLSNFLSKVTGNSITWNGGFFFNFNNAISNILDEPGGVVSKDTYDIDVQNLNTTINNVGQANQSIIENANQAIINATTDAAIYGKKLPNDLVTSGDAIDIAKGDTLYIIISKIQRWINKFKIATGIKISNDFAKIEGGQSINNNDTIDSAFRKVQGSLDKILDEDIPEVIKKGFYDYVVDSDDSLAGLINNPEAHTVLIKNGIWSYDFGDSIENVILLHSNTKIIHCQPNAVINITGSVSLREQNTVQSIITYNPATINDKIKEIKGLNLNITLRDTPISGVNCYVFGFSNLKNLYDCNISSFVPSGIIPKGYYNCDNLYDCDVKAGVSEGYVNCKNLKRCTANALSLCFYECENLEECYFSGTRTGVFSVFSSCRNLTRCYTDLICETNSGIFTGFLMCARLSNCYSKIVQNNTFNGTPYCFDGCYQMNSCYAYSEYGRNNKVHGFVSCRQVSTCINMNVPFPYLTSYASAAYTIGNECADTPAGGFNV